MKIPVLKLIHSISRHEFINATNLIQQAEELAFLYEEDQKALVAIQADKNQSK